MSEPIQYPSPYGKPVQHKRRRKLAVGYRYDSAGCLISPRGQLLFCRREGRKVVYVEGDMVQLYDAMRRLGKLGRDLRRELKGKR